jgi:hypothetical protein
MTLCIYVNMVQFPNIIIIPMTKNKGKNIMLSDYGWLIMEDPKVRWLQYNNP